MTNSQWAAMPLWKKRLQGFCSYLLCAVVALFYPVEVDKALLNVLVDQFTED